MAMKTAALGLFAVVTLAIPQAASSATGADTAKTTKHAQICHCQAQVVRRTAVRRQRRTYPRRDRGLAWAQTIEIPPRQKFFVPQPAPAVIAEGPTYNYYGPVTNYYGSPPPMMPQSAYYYGGYGGLPPADDAARLDPWHGYDPYRPENGY